MPNATSNAPRTRGRPAPHAPASSAPPTPAARTHKFRVIGSGEIDPEDLIIDEAQNGRRYPAKVTDMVISLVQHGQQSPILVRPWPRDARLKAVVFGFCRARAALEINEQGLTSSRFLLRYEEVDLDERGSFVANMVENRDRKEPSAIDHAYNLARLRDEYAMGQNEIARQLNVDKSWVSKTLRLLKLSAEEQKLVDEHHRTGGQSGIAAITAYELASIDDPAERKALLSKATKSTAPGASRPPAVTTSALRAEREKRSSKPSGKARSIKEVMLPFEAASHPPEGSDPSPIEQWCADFLEFRAGRLSAKEIIRRLRELAGEEK